MENDIKLLNKSAEEYADKTENKRKFTLIAKSSSMRSAKDKPKTLETIEKQNALCLLHVYMSMKN